MNFQSIKFGNSRGTISASQINRFRRCPTSYYFSKVLKTQIEVDMKYADLGTLIHECNKQYFDILKMYDQQKPTADEIESKYKEMTLNYNQYDKTLGGRFNKCVENFIKYEQKRVKTWERYLPDSTEEFIGAKEMAVRMAAVGFKRINFEVLMFGTIAIHWGEKARG